MRNEKKKYEKLKRLPVVLPLLLLSLSSINIQAQTNPGIREAKFTPERSSASFADVAGRVEAAVVNIDARSGGPEIPRMDGMPLPDDMMNMFGRPNRPSYSVGSGFIVDSIGHVITNFHVVDRATSLTVRLLNGKEHAARVIGVDEETDIAVLKIDSADPLPFIKFGNSDGVRVGDWVLALGSPFGLDRTVTAGIVSQIRRETPYGTPFQRFIQTDAAINKGNSGGPLVNLAGEVIGVNSQIATSTGDYNGIGFALPSNETLSVFEQILEHGRVKRGFLGVTLESVREEFAKVYELPEPRGAIITEVREESSPAAVAGLKVGDIVVAINDIKVDNALDMISKVGVFRPLEKIRVTHYRETRDKIEKLVTDVTLGERPSQSVREESPIELKKSSEPFEFDRERPFGLSLGELVGTSAEKQRFGEEKGIVVREMNPASFLADTRGRSALETLRRGDLIQRINRMTVVDTETFLSVAMKLRTGDPMVLHVLSYDPATRVARRKIVQYTVR